jgi:hypothetical protein
MLVKESTMTVKVRLHTYTSEERLSAKEQELKRIPSVGEYIALPEDSRWFKVEIVVHWVSSTLDGEVYALAVEPQDIIDESGFGKLTKY